MFISVAFLAVSVATEHTCILVRPETSNSSVCDHYHDTVANTSCRHDGCETLVNIVRNSSQYLASDSIDLFFLPGVHLLKNDSSFQVAGKKFLSLSGIEQADDTPTIQCDGNAGLALEDIGDLTLEHLIINECGSYLNNVTRAALIVNNTESFIMVNVTVQKSRGYGLSMCQYGGESTISNCTFQYNSGAESYAGGNAYLSFPCHSLEKNSTGSRLTVYSTKFLYGSFGYHNQQPPMASGLLIRMCSGVTIDMDDTTFEGNYAVTKNIIDQFLGSGGNLAILLDETTKSFNSSVVIENTRFINGTGGFGGGLLFNSSSFKLSTLNVSNCVFENNNAVFDGGAVYCHISHRNTLHHRSDMLVTDTKIKFANCNFSQNSIDSTQDAGVGIAFSIINIYVSRVFSKVSQAIARIYNCEFKNNSVLPNKDGQFSSTGSVFLVSEQFGKTLIADCTFADNYNASAIAAISSYITFSGSVEIRNNHGWSGAGIKLCEASYIILNENTTLDVYDNQADQYGGGIYVESICSQSHPLCFFQLDISESDMEPSFDDEIINTTHVYLTNNTAVMAGSQLYGGNIDYCYVSFGQAANFTNLFTVISNASDFSMIASAPQNVCFCINETNQNCSIKQKEIDAIYPGQNFSVYITVVGQREGRVQGIVQLSSINNKTFQYDINVNTVSKCESVSYRLYTRSVNQKETLVFNAKSTQYNTLIHGPNAINLTVPIQSCPLGFEVSQKNSCYCSPSLGKQDIKCDIDNGTILRSSPTWIGYHFANNGSNIHGTVDGVIYHYRCPYDYCSPNNVYIQTSGSTFEQDLQCDNNRVGLLCGTCPRNLSSILGSSLCKDCSGYTWPYALLLTLAIAAGGIVLVIVLFVCNFTVTEGTMSGLIFYANIFAVVSSTLLTDTNIKFATELVLVFLSWLNLDPGIAFCLYHKLNEYEKMWGYFILSVYLWTISVIIVLLCKKFTWAARLAGKNAVPVLATILLLSYFQINQGVIYALSYTTVNYPAPNGSTIPVKVWSMDATVTYLAGKHIPLFIAGVLFGTLSVIYTAALLFIRPLQKASHFKCFRWVNKLMPLIDAYSCPHIIEERKQFWNGLLLLTRGILCVITTLYGNDWPMLTLGAIIISCSVLCVLSWLLGGVYRKWYLNFICSAFLLNLIIVSTITLCLQNGYPRRHNDEDIDKHIAKCSYTSVFIAMLMFVGITILHSYKLVKRLELTGKFSRFVHRRLIVRPPSGYQRLPDVVASDEDVTRTTVSVNKVDYREPQLADFDSNTVTI